MNTSRLSGSEVSEYGAPDPSRMDRIVHALSEVSAKLWGLFAAALICGAAVLVEALT